MIYVYKLLIDLYNSEYCFIYWAIDCLSNLNKFDKALKLVEKKSRLL